MKNKLSSLFAILALVAMFTLSSLTAKAQTGLNGFNVSWQGSNVTSFYFSPNEIVGGTFLTIYVYNLNDSTTVNILTNENIDNTGGTWSDTTPGGMYVQMSNCNGSTFKLPILYVLTRSIPTFKFAQQINVYVPNNTGTEPYGSCGTSGSTTITIHPATGYNGNTNVVSSSINKASSRTAFYLRCEGAICGRATSPIGFHYNVVTAKYTSFITCADDPSACPISTSGNRNYLVFYTEGAEATSCYPCNSGDQASWAITVGGYTATREYTGQSFLGQEQSNFPIPNSVTAGRHNIIITGTNPKIDYGTDGIQIVLGAAN